MKFLVYKKFTEISGNKINVTDFSVKDQKVIELDENDYSKEELVPTAMARYCEITEIPEVDNCTVKIAVIDKDIANLKIDPYKCIRDYPNDTPIVNVIDTLTGITYPAAILVGTIPAGHVPTDEEILNYTFRGSKRHMDKSTKVKDMQVALPFDRIIIDLGSKSMMLPVNDRFEIEYLS